MHDEGMARVVAQPPREQRAQRLIGPPTLGSVASRHLVRRRTKAPPREHSHAGECPRRRRAQVVPGAGGRRLLQAAFTLAVVETLSRAEARRASLAAQGFSGRARGTHGPVPAKRRVLSLIDALGLLQIDSV